MTRLMMAGCVTVDGGNLIMSTVLNASDPYQRQPILNLRIKKAMKQGAKIYVGNSNSTELDRFATLKAIIPEHGAGAAAKVLLKYALSSSALKVEGYDDLRASIKRGEQAIRAAEDAFGARSTTQLQKLAEEIVGAKSAIILYDEMATLAPNCENLAEDLQTLAILTNNIDHPGAGVGPLFEDANSLGARDMGLLPDALPGYQTPP